MTKVTDFWIHITPREEAGFRVQVRSPAGDGHGVFEVPALQTGPVTAADLAPPERDVRRRDQARPRGDMGAALFEALFQGPVRSLYDSSIGKVGDGVLRIRIHLDLDDPGVMPLTRLPWELLYHGEKRSYLALSERTPVVRYLSVQRPSEPMDFSPPLRVLVVMANPEGTHPLNLEAEEANIRVTWAQQDHVQVTFLPKATQQTLLKILADEDFHVLHFMGHGDFDPATGEGLLLLEDEAGGRAPLSGHALGSLLLDEVPLRLVFLNACETGVSGITAREDPFAGVAAALVMAGIPAVLAMQHPISDAGAVVLADQFYRALARPRPVDAALTEARKAMQLASPEAFEWATPALFMRAPDGYLFTPPAAPRPPWQQARVLVPATLVVLLAAAGLFFGLRPDLALTPAAFTLTPQQTQPLVALLDGEPITVPEWRVADTTIATVLEGRVRAQAPGTTTIEARLSLLRRARAEVTVQAHTIASVQILGRRSYSLTAGDSLALRALLRDANGRGVPEGQVTWHATPDTIATVSAHGMVYALRPGQATLFATGPAAVRDSATVHVRR